MTNTRTCVIFGLAAGLAAGLAIGMAIAPRPGEETREMLLTRLKWLTWSPKERYMYLWKRTCESEA